MTGLERSYGNSIDLTIYRCVQESLTNVLRHAQATVRMSALRRRDGFGADASYQPHRAR